MRLNARWREARWFVRCVRHNGWRDGLEVWRTISPHPAPAATLWRLRRRVITGDWVSPDDRDPAA